MYIANECYVNGVSVKAGKNEEAREKSRQRSCKLVLTCWWRPPCEPLRRPEAAGHL